MGKLKKVALITCASNFERHKNIIEAVHRRFREMGGYVLYVVTCYGVFIDQTDFKHGEPAIYSLLDHLELDGCIIEANLGSESILNFICEKLEKRKIPAITINIEREGIPFISLDSYTSGRCLVDHMIEVHHCRKINLVLHGSGSMARNLELACRDACKDHGLEFDENRVYSSIVSIQNGRRLVEQFREDGTDDADAVICSHDVHAIGYCLELEKRGKHVPEDVLLCSLNRSANSIVFRPDITGVDRLDGKVAARACEMLEKLMAGEQIEYKTFYSGEISFGASCGCNDFQRNILPRVYQQLIVTKVSSGDQVSSMMRFNGDLEDVDTLEQLAENIKMMMQGIGCDGFFCCLNSEDEKYILNQTEDTKNYDSPPYDDTMKVITGVSTRTGEIKGQYFPLSEVAPVKVCGGDMLIFIPIHHKERDYGYMVFLNEDLPVEVYNYRICHESLGISIENLHKQMILKSSIAELDKLHMIDQMTGLYNRFAISRFRDEYVESGHYTVVMMDMDGLKTVNDNFGHLAGNNAICTTSNAIRKCLGQDDLVIRYGGDEFVALSHNTDAQYWTGMRQVLNDKLKRSADHQKLSYKIGASLGFYIVDSSKEEIDLAEALERADREMYEDKKLRKAGRGG